MTNTDVQNWKTELEDKFRINKKTEAYTYVGDVENFIDQLLQESIRDAQIKMFNRIWEKSAGKSTDDVESILLVFRELNVIRKELSPQQDKEST